MEIIKARKCKYTNKTEILRHLKVKKKSKTIKTKKKKNSIIIIMEASES